MACAEGKNLQTAGGLQVLKERAETGLSPVFLDRRRDGGLRSNRRRCRSSCAEEGAAGKILCVHDGYHLKFRLKEWQSLHSRRDLP